MALVPGRAGGLALPQCLGERLVIATPGIAFGRWRAKSAWEKGLAGVDDSWAGVMGFPSFGNAATRVAELDVQTLDPQSDVELVHLIDVRLEGFPARAMLVRKEQVQARPPAYRVRGRCSFLFGWLLGMADCEKFYL
jgi:hypothetical protein